MNLEVSPVSLWLPVTPTTGTREMFAIRTLTVIPNLSMFIPELSNGVRRSTRFSSTTTWVNECQGDVTTSITGSACCEKRPMHPSRHRGYDARLGRSDDIGAGLQVCAFRMSHRHFSVRSILADSGHGYSSPDEGLSPAPQVVFGANLGSRLPLRYRRTHPQGSSPAVPCRSRDIEVRRS